MAQHVVGAKAQHTAGELLVGEVEDLGVVVGVGHHQAAGGGDDPDELVEGVLGVSEGVRDAPDVLTLTGTRPSARCRSLSWRSRPRCAAGAGCWTGSGMCTGPQSSDVTVCAETVGGWRALPESTFVSGEGRVRRERAIAPDPAR